MCQKLAHWVGRAISSRLRWSRAVEARGEEWELRHTPYFNSVPLLQIDYPVGATYRYLPGYLVDVLVLVLYSLCMHVLVLHVRTCRSSYMDVHIYMYSYILVLTQELHSLRLHVDSAILVKPLAISRRAPTVSTCVGVPVQYRQCYAACTHAACSCSTYR